MITLDRKTGQITGQDPIAEDQQKALARAFAAMVLPEILRDRETQHREAEPHGQATRI